MDVLIYFRSGMDQERLGKLINDKETLVNILVNLDNSYNMNSTGLYIADVVRNFVTNRSI